jgi:hypothetical protein
LAMNRGDLKLEDDDRAAILTLLRQTGVPI